ncbi:MAG: proline--tRNA ligase [Desulfobacterales bacterium]|jgi:prolyl-tRNA synthetase|nr:proline--tRNA ligase [Desulfobacteraceae bacterium]MDD3990565.1 proline--tRNA ligase [Desulfobacteraceae bacterium]MDY0310797.1 proline--tRNA ligase [Desulfobacterales bacterium]
MTPTSPQSAIRPTRVEDYPEWYQQVIKASDMAENSPVRGCMVIKPWGFALWENITRIVDARLKAIGVRNAYFPIFIPLNFLEKEAQHVEGFAKECAVVTHHRLEKGADGGLVPAGPLTEPLIVRPTSETIIGDSFSKWVKSYRDLPILINQWGNVVRWEMRTRIFLRTSEFLWHEGHTVHATAEEAMKLTETILDIYVDLAENFLAIPVITGKKSPSERFPGADDTLTIEAMMQDCKALQAGTSHFLGQNFARAQQIKYQDANEQEQFAWTTSWAVSTRLLGGLIMTHGDDDGAILPPRIASSHLVLLPIVRKAADQGPVMAYVDALAQALRSVAYHGQPLQVEVDARDTGGTRNWDWIKKGIPLRVEIGPRDLANDAVFFARRDRDHRDKTAMGRAEFIATVGDILDDIQNRLHHRALAFQKAHTREIDGKEDFYAYFTPQDMERPEIHGGFALAHWCGDPGCEEKIKADLGVTIRCLPFDESRFPLAPGHCIVCGRQSPRRVIFAKSY